ncbi:hypothetical protein COV03_04390 [Candidatus Uhrbacteria bacterium CG10_big_fil_rev_8_21_14_0_10_41_26]|nr:MAG: hypothetical protein COZ45_00695 [Candidatus Uhrbacteria bacterium CG_4_10_14_3_um_filter_41_21]PJE74649.1 MAG: hypothetical protein COV03_04390 [Candidatus Uhrbacteria bacterium CG10_big_fil_rev_8_21_14_0_10_41_26]
MKNQKGFTKIEILVVTAIVGLLGIMAVVSVMTARSRTRDAVRLSDVRQIQSGLELYFIDTNSYPIMGDVTALGTAVASCLGVDGFGAPCATGDKTYLDVVPFTPTLGLSGASTCSGYSNAYCYYSNSDEYYVQFELEHANPQLELQKGVNCATPSGLDAGACQTLTPVQ